ncbi:hypothetical protein KIM372_16990 [Bombiscardovia nodaiensis]|uniref:RCC1-like domain-containing protein n=1 Tax=Bombiscardovia nodaiensis TaxID=2932181 RepID=A0ABM8BA34_9BIFI|nr:hypothetical protein KIM372_16990 [Bombiscardovia nodaiensis]
MHRHRSIGTFVLALGLIFLGGGVLPFVQPTHADPAQNELQNQLIRGGNSGSETVDGFTLSPIKGPANMDATATVTPPSAPAGVHFTQVSAGTSHSLALGSDGSVYSWGSNSWGQLGNDDDSNPSGVSLALRVHTPSNVRFTQVSAGDYHSLALTSDGKIYAWGINRFGQLGDGTASTQYAPVLVRQGALPTQAHYTAISAGGNHSLALGSDGKAYAWGLNYSGELGTNSNVSSSTPVQVQQGELPAGQRYLQVSASAAHSVALGSDGYVYGWGQNSEGELGNNSVSDQMLPVRAAPLPGGRPCKQVSTGAWNTAAVDSNGDAFVWGNNDYGQIGDNTNTVRYTPAKVLRGALPAGVTFTQISVGYTFVIALGSNGRAYAWGNNSTGQLGDTTTTNRSTPVWAGPGAVPAGKRFTQISAGNQHSLALGTDHKAYGWGWNNSGELGNGGTATGYEPGLVAVPKYTIVSVSFGTKPVTQYTVDSSTGAWKMQVPRGAIGTVNVPVNYRLDTINPDGTVTQGPPQTATLHYEYKGVFIVHFALGGAPSSAVPDQYVFSDDPQPIKWPDPMSTWANHWFDGWFKTDGNPWDFSKPVTASMTLTAKWEAYQFTLNPNSGSTNGHAKTVVTAPDPPKGIRYTQVTAGWYHSVAIGSDGNTYAWGHNQYGQLGTDDTTGTNQSQPVRVHTPTGVHFLTVDAGYWHTFATGSDGKLYAWGFNGDGRLGVGGVASQLKPAPVKTDNLPAGTRLVTASAGGYHSLGIDSNGQLYTWGGNDKGELGTNDLAGRLIPTPVTTNIPTGTRFKQVSAGFQYSEALDTNGHLYAWGENANGQLGVNDYTQRNIPTPVITDNITPGTQIAQVSSGAYHTLATDTNGRPYAWGNNNNGQLSITGITQAPKPTPINTTGITPNVRIESVKAGAYYSMALDNNGRAYTWGYNDYGQLGSNDLTQHNLATAINTDNITVNTRIIQITGNYYHSLAINNQYTTYAWGANSNGQIGNGTTTQQLKATPVGLQRLTVTGVKFDNIPAPTGPTLANGTSNKWNTTTPPHPTGDVDTTIEWTLGNYPQTNYTLTYTYWFDLPAAGTIPLQRYSGSTIFALTSAAGLLYAGRLVRRRKRQLSRAH